MRILGDFQVNGDDSVPESLNVIRLAAVLIGRFVSTTTTHCRFASEPVDAPIQVRQLSDWQRPCRGCVSELAARFDREPRPRRKSKNCRYEAVISVHQRETLVGECRVLPAHSLHSELPLDRDLSLTFDIDSFVYSRCNDWSGVDSNTV